MSKQEAIKIFEEKKVRTLWDSEEEKWYISIVDVVKALTDSVDPTAYWRKLKQRLKAEGNETVTNCHGLKMQAPDSKMRMTDVADTDQGGHVAKVARKELEARTGKNVVSGINAKNQLKLKKGNNDNTQ